MPALKRRLDADGDSFLTDVEVAETTDEAQAVKLTRAFLETADQERQRFSNRSRSDS